MIMVKVFECYCAPFLTSIQFNNLLFQSNSLQLRNKNVEWSASIYMLGRKYKNDIMTSQGQVSKTQKPNPFHIAATQ